MYDFSDQVALVTGAGSGIGRDCSEGFASAGARVVVSDINAEWAEETAERCRARGAEAVAVVCDVGDDAAVASLMDHIEREFGRLDCAFNNAGVSGVQAHVADLAVPDFLHTVNINLSGVYRCLHHEARIMRAQKRGAIVNCSSILGLVGFAGAAAYVAAKHGVVGLTKAAAIDLATEGVRVNAICPGFIDTPMLAQAGITTDAPLRSSIEALHPMARLGTGEEIAHPVLWLCSRQAAFVTGQALTVDGGYVAQ